MLALILQFPETSEAEEVLSRVKAILEEPAFEIQSRCIVLKLSKT
jgi:uncharacterized membrane protein